MRLTHTGSGGVSEAERLAPARSYSEDPMVSPGQQAWRPSVPVSLALPLAWRVCLPVPSLLERDDCRSPDSEWLASLHLLTRVVCIYEELIV